MDYVTTKLTSSDANVFFGKGQGEFPLSSSVLEATLRYIAVTRHQGDIEKIRLINTHTTQFRSADRGDYYTDNDCDLFILTARPGASLLAIDEEGWVSLDNPPYPVAPFLSKASETRVYINTEKKKAIIFVRNATTKWITLLCSAMFRILPWYFADGVTETDTALFQALNKDDEDKFREVINNACAAFDFKKAVLKRNLLGWGNAYRDAQIRDLEEKSRECLENIYEYETRISQLLNDVDKYSFNINSLRAQRSENSNVVYDYFASRNQLSLYKIRENGYGKSLYFSITDTLEFYDRDAFIRIYEQAGSMFSNHDDPVTKVFYGIFGENKGVFRVESMFQLDNLSSLTPYKDARSGAFSMTHLPHPHLYHYGCLGANQAPIKQFMRDGSWDMAIDQAIAATKNVNFGDAVVLSAFIRDVRGVFDECRCVIAENGKELTPREFLGYLETSREDNTNG